MNNYKPQLWHAIFTASIGIVCAGLYAYPTRWENAWLIGAITFLLMTAAIFALTFAEANRSFYQTIAYVAEQLAKLNPDQWEALGIRFPHLRIRWNGQPIKFFEDTQATMDNLERFMRDSNTRQISPERNWSSGPDRRAWTEIRDWLEDNGYIYQQSAAGNHSWLWRGNMHSILWTRYIDGVEHSLPNLNEIDGPPAASLEHHNIFRGTMQ